MLAQVKNIAADQSKIVCCFLLGSCHRNRYHVVVRYHRMFLVCGLKGCKNCTFKIIVWIIGSLVIRKYEYY